MLINPALEFALPLRWQRQSLPATHRVKTKRKVRKLDKPASDSLGGRGVGAFIKKTAKKEWASFYIITPRPLP
jgi:hypothetical protein